MLSRYNPSSAFMYIPAGNRSGRGSWHPSGRDAAPPNELCFVSEPAAGLGSLPRVRGAPVWPPACSEVGAESARVPSPCPQLSWALGLAQRPRAESCCPIHSQEQKFVFKTVVEDESFQLWKQSGECALVLFVAVASDIGLRSISVEAPKRR